MERFLRKKLAGGKFKNVSPIRSKMMKAIKSKGNKTTELKFCLALEKEGIFGWKVHERIIGNPDITFPIYKIALFLDGCFWHGCPKCGHIPKTNNAYWKAKIMRNKRRDFKKAEALKQEGHMVIRFWEHEIINDLNNCICILKEVIEDRLAFVINQD